MSSRRPRSSVAACRRARSSRGNDFGEQLLATGTGLAVRTAAVPAHAALESSVGAQLRRLRPGSPVTTDERLMCRDWGKPRRNGMLKKQLRKPSLKRLWPRKNIPGRRRFAPAEPVRKESRIEGRRDEETTDVCPRHTRLTQGKTQLPQALCRPCWRALQAR